jgi:aspartate racemase
MKKIGLVGGISWTSTMDYYRYINEAVNAKLGGINFAECIIYSVNFEKFCTSNAAHDWDATFELLSAAALHLKDAGAECILLCANTAHVVAERVAGKVELPLVDIRTATARAIQSKKLQKVGLLGTVYTMEMDFFKDKLLEHNIKAFVPENEADRTFIEQTIVHELGKGILLEATRKEFIRIANGLLEQGAEGIVLGCTEIPLLIGQEHFDVPVFNTTLIHAQAAVAFAIQ